MKTKTINLYSFDELSKEAKQKVINKFRADNDMPFLLEAMHEKLWDLLERYEVKSEEGHPAEVFYSLTNCQGDGAMFTGNFEWEGHTVHVRQWGRYCHSNSKEVTWPDFVGEEKEAEEEAVAKSFEEVYQKICKELERYGYDYIDEENSDERIKEEIAGNDYSFREDGTIEN